MIETQQSTAVEVTVDYVPAVKPFHAAFQEADSVEVVRQAAMNFFGVSDHQDRDTHRFWLEFDGRRLTNPAETLGDLLGEHRRGAKFLLVEEITKGAA